MIAVGPFQATHTPGDNPVKVMVIGYAPENDKFLAIEANGNPSMFDRIDLNVDWHYDATTDNWGHANRSETLYRELAMASSALELIAAYTHTEDCRNKDDFTVWDCNCNPLKPDAMARYALEQLEEIRDEDLQPANEEVSVPPSV